MKIPSITQAELLLAEAERINSGPWVDHNRVAGRNAGIIAGLCNMNEEAAFVLGYLHDIGRRARVVTDLKHIIDGYNFMNSLGFEDSARICLTHSFPYKDIRAYNGQNDCTAEESCFIQNYIESIEYNDYDRLIQLCDAISFPTGATYVEKRLVDVVIRRGFNEFTIPKWKAFLGLKDYFDEKCGCDIYSKLLESTRA